MKKDKLINIIIITLRILPIIIILSFVAIITLNFDKISISDILHYVPKNYFLAIITFLILYLVKSLSIVFPLMILYITSGIIFTPIYGILVNIVGLFISLSVPYWIGRFCGRDLLDKLTLKYNKLEKLQIAKTKNKWFVSYILRMIGIIPVDIVSMSLGAIKVNYKKYISGSLIGLLPKMIIQTYIGEAIIDPTSSRFILLALFTTSLSIISIYLHYKYKEIYK
ncbi:MAG: VTT domain-containing protein [Bacillota bacterium]|nr:VTT domain-containing protein [Bacillota bacterium]